MKFAAYWLTGSICDRIEHALAEEVGEAIVKIHLEPERRARRTGIRVLQVAALPFSVQGLREAECSKS